MADPEKDRERVVCFWDGGENITLTHDEFLSQLESISGTVVGLIAAAQCVCRK